MHELQSLKEHLRPLGQEHVLRWWDELSPDARQSLAEQVDGVDFPAIRQLTEAHAATSGSGAASAETEESPRQKAARAVPPPGTVRVPSTDAERAEWEKMRKAGEEILRSGRVGVILVAGGQGTRLDFPQPKGMYPIGPASKKTLFQILAEQVRARGRDAGVTIPYYVMTSDATHRETVDFFQSQKYFGLAPVDVHFFQQGSMPAVDKESGRLLMSGRGELSTSPDGHGGILAALKRAGLLDSMRKRGIEYLFYHQVDNPLVQVCEPAFLGYHATRGSEVSTKVVAKKTPAEKVGLIVEVDGRTQIIEYSDFPEEFAGKRDERGELLFWAGNTAIHLFNRSFLDRIVSEHQDLPLHRALKKVPFLDDQGNLVKPERENAYKFERFIFDALPLAREALVLETRREQEFAPLKNKEGEFSPDDVRRCLSKVHREWLRACGKTVHDDAIVEISPLLALDAGQLVDRLKGGSPRQIPPEGPIALEP